MNNKSLSCNNIKMMILPKISEIKTPKQVYSLSPTFKVNNRLIGNILFPNHDQNNFNSNYILSLKKKAKAMQKSQRNNDIQGLSILSNPIELTILGNKQKNKYNNHNYQCSNNLIKQSKHVNTFSISQQNMYDCTDCIIDKHLTPIIQRMSIQNNQFNENELDPFDDNSFEMKEQKINNNKRIVLDESPIRNKFNDKTQIELFDKLRQENYRNSNPIISLRKINSYRTTYNVKNNPFMLNISKIIDKTRLMRHSLPKKPELNTQELFSYDHEKWRKRNTGKLKNFQLTKINNKKKELKDLERKKMFGLVNHTNKSHKSTTNFNEFNSIKNDIETIHQINKKQSVSSLIETMEKQTEKMSDLLVEYQNCYNEMNLRKHYYYPGINKEIKNIDDTKVE